MKQRLNGWRFRWSSLRSLQPPGLFLVFRYGLGVILIYTGITWWGVEKPNIEFSPIYVSEGIPSCYLSGSGAGMGGAYKMDGIKYVDRFSRVFGWGGSGCDPGHNNRRSKIYWVPIPGDDRIRLYLMIGDVSSGRNYGVPISKRIEIWKAEFDSVLFLVLAKAALIVVGCGLVLRELLVHSRRKPREMKNGESN